MTKNKASIVCSYYKKYASEPFAHLSENISEEIVEYWIRLNKTNSDVRMYTLIIYFIH